MLAAPDVLAVPEALLFLESSGTCRGTRRGLWQVSPPMFLVAK